MKNLFRIVTLGMLAGFIAGYWATCGGGASQTCTPGESNCQPTCSDGVQTAPETDIDCGGDVCGECANNLKCNVGTDCASHSCVNGTCQDPSCTDSSKNASETDIDCGGPCMPCGVGKGCIVAADCTSGLCTGGKCKAPGCDDGLKNGTETDIDCGGGTCPACNLGQGCTASTDCGAYLCDIGKCGLGNGGDGPLALATGMNLSINTTASPATGTQGTTTATLGNATGFTAGQTVFIHQTQGAGAGNHELNRIETVNGTAVTLAKPQVYTYVTGAQMVVVPQYTTVSIATGATVTAPAWDGGQGGILAFQATGSVTLDGAITMAAKGFRGGGDAVACFPGSPGCMINHGRYGESEAGASTFSAQNAQGYGGNSGSGGGGGTRGQDCAAGGGGSHGTAGSQGADGTNGNCVANGKNGGGLPGTPLGSPDLTQKIFLGGGGGEGGPDEDGTHPGVGGNGGGLVVLYASAVTVNAAGTIDASGQTASSGANVFVGCGGGGGGGMGNGGGGAGGAIRILSAGAAALGSGQITALGGSGGNQGTCGAGFSGGAGGGGRIHVRASSTPTGSANPAPYID